MSQRPALAVRRVALRWMTCPFRSASNRPDRASPPSVLIQHGISLENCRFVDLAIASYLLDPDQQMSRERLVMETIGWDVFHSESDTAKEQAVLNVACAASKVGEEVQKWLDTKGLTDTANLENSLIAVLARMELDGVLVDGKALDELAEQFSAEKKRCVPGRVFRSPSPMTRSNFSARDARSGACSDVRRNIATEGPIHVCSP